MNEFMKEAIDLSESNLTNKYGGPFGACVVKDNEIVGRGVNMVIKNNDPTAHAEVTAIRDACNRLNTYDLSDCVLYTSCYPCPMCLSAVIWSNIKTVYYANTKEDADDIGFRDEFIYDYLKSFDESVLKLNSLNREEAIKVFEQYKLDSNKVKISLV